MGVTEGFFGEKRLDVEEEASAEENRFAAGRRVDEGRRGRGRSGIGGMEERADSRLLAGVGKPVDCMGSSCQSARSYCIVQHLE